MKEIKNIRELVTEAGKDYAERIAYRYIENKEMIEKTYAEVKADTDAFGRMLEKLGMVGKHVAVIGPTSYEYLVTYFGAASSGSVIVPIDRELPNE